MPGTEQTSDFRQTIFGVKAARSPSGWKTLGEVRLSQAALAERVGHSQGEARWLIDDILIPDCQVLVAPLQTVKQFGGLSLCKPIFVVSRTKINQRSTESGP